MDPNIPHRFVTSEARSTLAARFGLRNDPSLQDWPWEVADPSRFAAFLDAYTSGDLDEDERFALMEILIQCVEDMGLTDVATAPEWRAVADLLRRNPRLHARSIHDWSCGDDDDPAEGFRVSGPMRDVRQAIERGEAFPSATSFP